MSVDDVIARHELEMKHAELADELVALKASGDRGDRYREVKNELSALREFWRGIRECLKADLERPAVVGDASVDPATVETKGDI
jgi:hypothetical protein